MALSLGLMYEGRLSAASHSVGPRRTLRIRCDTLHVPKCSQCKLGRKLSAANPLGGASSILPVAIGLTWTALPMIGGALIAFWLPSAWAYKAFATEIWRGGKCHAPMSELHAYCSTTARSQVGVRP